MQRTNRHDEFLIALSSICNNVNSTQLGIASYISINLPLFNANHVTQADIEKIVDVSINHLIPPELSSRNNSTCIVSHDILRSLHLFQFDSTHVRAVPENETNKSTSLFPTLVLIRDYMMRKLTDRIKKELSSFVMLTNSSNLREPPIVHALGLLREILFELQDDVCCHMMDYISPLWPLFGKLVEKQCIRAMTFRDGQLTDQEEVLLREVLQFWKCALHFAQTQSTNTTHNQSLVSTLAETLKACLTVNDQNIGRPLRPIATHLLLRSLKSLNKHIDRTTTEHIPAGAIVDSIVLHLLCGSQNSGDYVDHVMTETDSVDSLSPLAAALAHEESQQHLLPTESGTQCVLDRPDTSVCLRLLILSGLDLANRLDDTNENKPRVLHALRTLTLASRNTTDSEATFEASIISLLSGDDAHLFRGLDLWTIIHDQLAQATTSNEHAFQFTPNAQQLFLSLSVSIDHSPYTLIDWLVSPETDCLTYLVHFLRGFRLYRHADDKSSSRHPIRHHQLPENQSRMLERVSRCLQLLRDDDNLPFSPQPLIRSIEYALSKV